MSILTLMRHGQASFGQASYDTLSTLGREQARATGGWLQARGETVTGLWHGPRARQIDTARLVAEACGHDATLQQAAGLNEFAEGEEILAAASALFGRPMIGAEAPTRTEQLSCYDAAFEAWSQGNLAIPGRASFAEFRHGAGQWLRDFIAARDAVSGQRILAVSSAGTIAAMVCEVLGLPDPQWSVLTRLIRNGSLTEIVFSRRRAGLYSFNSTAHLPPRLSSSI
jgi:broad specificity phosphatase PhoE